MCNDSKIFLSGVLYTLIILLLLILCLCLTYSPAELTASLNAACNREIRCKAQLSEIIDLQKEEK